MGTLQPLGTRKKKKGHQLNHKQNTKDKTIREKEGDKVEGC